MAYIKSLKNQNWLLPPNLSDMIPTDHVCLLVESFVNEQDFSSFDIKYSGAGHPAYHPRILLKLLIMGILDRVRSSRRLARNARENIVYMYLSEKLCPDFRTISDFRKNNPLIVKEIFKHTVILAKTQGLLDLSNLATDGTKLKANAANKSVLLKEELVFLTNFVDDELEEWAKKDSIENDFFKEIRGNDELPKSSKKKMQRAVKHYIRKLKEKDLSYKSRLVGNLKQAKEELSRNNLKKVNTTDFESRFMLSKKGKIEFSYNPQITTEKNGFILANDVCNEPNDVHQLEPQVLQTKENIEEIPKNTKWSFDKGYFEGLNMNILKINNIDGYIACQKEPKIKFYDKRNFTYCEKNDIYTCPEGKNLKFQIESLDKTKNKKIRFYRRKSCKDCSKLKICTKRKDKVRIIKRYPFEKEIQQMRVKMKTKKGKEVYKLRKQIVEFGFGDIKENKGVVSFLTRSLETVKTEFNLISIAINLSKIWKMASDNI